MRLLFTVWGGLCGERTPYEDLFIAGAELACRQHAESLAAFGHEVTFACLGPRDRDERVNGVHLLQRRHPLAGRKTTWEGFWVQHFPSILATAVNWTADLVRSQDIDAIYTRVLWPTGILGHKVQQVTGAPCVATVDDKVFVEQLLDGPGLLPESVRLGWEDEMTAACEGVGRLILLAKHLGPEVRRFTHSPAAWQVIPSGLDMGRFTDVAPVDWHAEFSWHRDRLLLMCAARLDWPKRQDLLIEAVAELVADGMDLGLILLGAGSQEARLQHLRWEHGLKERVRFLGYQPNERVPACLQGADVICAPTDWEAFPIQLLEGLATGKPMIVSDAPPYDDVLADQEFIPLCANDVSSWTTALRRTIADRRRTDLEARRRTFVQGLLAKYTQEATSRAIEAVLAEVAETTVRV
jgi:glycosyltransferase involved in cell wall biosynthesis